MLTCLHYMLDTLAGAKTQANDALLTNDARTITLNFVNEDSIINEQQHSYQLISQNSQWRHGGNMTVNIRVTEPSIPAEPLDILALYRTMVTARVTNDILKIRKTQG